MGVRYCFVNHSVYYSRHFLVYIYSKYKLASTLQLLKSQLFNAEQCGENNFFEHCRPFHTVLSATETQIVVFFANNTRPVLVYALHVGRIL